jgi:uncharacterized membrane protein YgaE (UPF0421/DUF939 family)
MRASEEVIIKAFLIGAYRNLQKLREQEEQRSERFPMVSKELACAQSEYDVLSRLVRQLEISNPCDRLECGILCVED